MLHNSQKDFLKRHIGPSDEDQNKMLKELNYKSLDDLIKNRHLAIQCSETSSQIS